MSDPNIKVAVTGHAVTLGGLITGFVTDINTYLQAMALLVAIVSGVMTFIYHYNKNKKLKE